MDNNVFNGDESEFIVADPNIFFNLQFQRVPPLDYTLSVCDLSLQDRLDYCDQQSLFHHHHSTGENVVELGKDQQLIEPHNLVDLSGMSSSLTVPNSTSNRGDSNSPEDSEGFSDIILSYINQLLMEEDSNEEIEIYQEHNPALLAAEKTFYEILEDKRPVSPDKPPLYSSPSSESVEENNGNDFNSSDGNHRIRCSYDAADYQELSMNQTVIDFSSQSFYPSSSLSCTTEHRDRLECSEFYVQPSTNWQLNEAQNLILHSGKSQVNTDVSNDARKTTDVSSTRRKNLQDDELDVAEGRSNKHSAISFDDPPHSDTLEAALLSDGVTDANGYRTDLQVKASKSSNANSAKGTGGRRGRGKRQPKKEVVDLRTMLIQCAQSVSNGDERTAKDLLKQIKQHAVPHGDGNRRLAHYFAHGLEARLAGTGGQVHKNVYSMKLSVTDVLKAYKLYTTSCPFKKVSHFFSDQTILNISKNTMRLHIVDFGINYGLQWPCFMQQLSKRPGGPPRLHITGIDLPLRGFRPTELLDETGRRLSEYARKFGISFEFQAVAAKWETLQVEDLNIDDDELLIVNCLYRFTTLMDESVVADSPRNIVLNLIRKLKPALFVHGIINGCYGVPFFLSRFREALFNFSSLSDMIEATVPLEDESRLMIEKLLIGRDVMSVIACEGSDRTERPETYKQWHMRTVNAGFAQIQPSRNIMKKVKDKVKSCYHKDFVVDEDSQWLLLGWKGRILHALSIWKPNSCL